MLKNIFIDTVTKYFFAVACFTVLFSGNAAAHQTPVDSLKNIVLSKSSLTSQKSDACYNLAKIYYDTNKVQSLYFALKQYSITKNENDLSGSLNALELIINLYDAQNRYDSSFFYGTEAVKTAEQLNADSDIAYFSGLCGGICIKTGNFFEALQNYKTAVSLSRKNGWVKREASFLNNIGSVYYLLGDELTALDYYIKAYNLKRKNGSAKQLTPGLINIGGIYSIIGEQEQAFNYLSEALKYAELSNNQYYIVKTLISMGDVKSKQKMVDDAENYYMKALKQSSSLDDLTVRSNILTKIGSINIKKGTMSDALKYTKDALALSDSVNYLYGVSVASQQLGTIYLFFKNYKKAEQYFLKALHISEDINAVDNLLDDYKSLSELYRITGKAGKALKYFTKYATVKDSIFNNESHKKYNAVKAKYEVEKKQAELNRVKLETSLRELKQRQYSYLLLGAIGLLIVIMLVVILIYRQHKVKSLQQTIQLEQRLLRSQLNPHFIFNALTAIQRFIFDKSPMLAGDYLGKFSQLIRFILNSSTVDAISVDDEIAFLTNYLDLQQARFDNKFTYTILADKNIDTENSYIAPMLLQPVVENAVEHGVGHLEKGGVISINFQPLHNNLIVTVTDNGVGRKKAALISSKKHKNHKSLSTSIINQRLIHLNKRKAGKIVIETIDLTDYQGKPSGTKVVIKMPFMQP